MKTTGIDQIVDERRRQMLSEGFTAAHDDQWEHGELSAAALSYIEVAAEQAAPHFPGENRPWETRTDWPWISECWNPSDDPVRNLVKAGALIAAEVDRLQRAVKRVGV